MLADLSTRLQGYVLAGTLESPETLVLHRREPPGQTPIRIRLLGPWTLAKPVEVPPNGVLISRTEWRSEPGSSEDLRIHFADGGAWWLHASRWPWTSTDLPRAGYIYGCWPGRLRAFLSPYRLVVTLVALQALLESDPAVPTMLWSVEGAGVGENYAIELASPGRWIVYHSERGNRNDPRLFSDEGDAVAYFLALIRRAMPCEGFEPGSLRPEVEPMASCRRCGWLEEQHRSGPSSVRGY